MKITKWIAENETKWKKICKAEEDIFEKHEIYGVFYELRDLALKYENFEAVFVTFLTVYEKELGIASEAFGMNEL